MASDCKDDNEYLKKSLLVIEDWESDIESAVSKIFYENIPEINKFKSALKEIKKSIKEIQKISIDRRTFEE